MRATETSTPAEPPGSASRRPIIVLALAFTVAFLAVGIPYWGVPYARIALPNTLITLALLAPFLGAALARFPGRASLWRATVVVGASVPGAVLARVVVDGLADPTSHNLWPFELILASFVGFPVAFAGALLGSVLLLVIGRGVAP